MTNFIPILPLNLVVFPGEKLNLHIFEPRYIQLINECFTNKKNFGIPTVINNELKEIGTSVSILEISKTYDNGSMDIKTEGQQIFKILEIIKGIETKLYNGAIVSYLANNIENGNSVLLKKIIPGMRAIFKQLNVDKDFNKEDEDLKIYDIAHLVGMSIEEEYLLLELNSELHRQEYLRRHLTKILPLIEELETLRKKIKLNGHFKNPKGFKFL
ncbi:MAG: LON peptidase substrate-binding domain-containing protein [Ferruginibacter sp.]